MEAVKQTGVAVDRASRDYQAAVDTYIGADPSIKLAKFRKSLLTAAGRLIEVTVFSDHSEVANAMDADDWENFEGYFTQANKWWDRVKAERPTGLRVVGGGSDV